MTDTTPRAIAPQHALDALSFNDDGTITMVEPDGTETRFGPLTLVDYATTIDDDMAIEAWLGDVSDERRARREAIDAADKSERPVLTREWNADKRRHDLEWKQRNTTAFVDMMTRSNPQWTPPDRMPQWFGTGGLVRMCLNHWDTVPFRGLVKPRAGVASQNGNDPTT